MAIPQPEASAAYDKILTTNLQRALDFLKFAEAKNAALLALASAWFLAIINLQCSGKPIPKGFDLSLQLALPMALLAALVALISFFPKLNLPHFFGGKRAGPHSKNLLYFGDISTVPIKTLEQEFRTRYLPDDSRGYRDEYFNDLAVQISVNSEIALLKMRLFRCGLFLIGFAGLALLISAISVFF
jgi:hypothetical protein